MTEHRPETTRRIPGGQILDANFRPFCPLCFVEWPCPTGAAQQQQDTASTAPAVVWDPDE